MLDTKYLLIKKKNLSGITWVEKTTNYKKNYNYVIIIHFFCIYIQIIHAITLGRGCCFTIQKYYLSILDDKSVGHYISVLSKYQINKHVFSHVWVHFCNFFSFYFKVLHGMTLAFKIQMYVDFPPNNLSGITRANIFKYYHKMKFNLIQPSMIV